MAAKKRKSSIDSFKRELPTPAETNKVFKSDQTEPKKPSKNKTGRPTTKGHRKHFNTMLDPSIKKKLSIIAAMEEKTTADIIEEMAKEYIKTKYPKL